MLLGYELGYYLAIKKVIQGSKVVFYASWQCKTKHCPSLSTAFGWKWGNACFPEAGLQHLFSSEKDEAALTWGRMWLYLNRSMFFFLLMMKSIKRPFTEICLSGHHHFWWLILGGTPAGAGRVVLEGEMSCWCLPAAGSCLKGLRKIEKPETLSCFAPLRMQGKILSPSVKDIKEKEGKSKERKEGRSPLQVFESRGLLSLLNWM